MAVANTGLANLLDPLFEGGRRHGPVMVSGSVERKHITGSPDRYIPVAAISSTSLRFRTGFKALDTARPAASALSRLRSATTLRNLLFSSSSCFSRRIWPAVALHTLLPIEVGRLADPGLAANTATAIPSAPSLRMNAFCASESLHRSRSPSGGNYLGKF